MKAFEIHLNGRYLLTAGVGDRGVLTTLLTSASVPSSPPRGGLSLDVSGYDGGTQEHVYWSAPKINVGDEVTIRIIDTDQISTERLRRRHKLDSAEALRRALGDL